MEAISGSFEGTHLRLGGKLLSSGCKPWSNISKVWGEEDGVLIKL